MASMSEGCSPARARRRSVSVRVRPQSTRTRVPPTSATRQLPPLPLASDAKRSKLPQLLVQQREDAARGLRRLGVAVLVQDVDLALGARLGHLHPVLLGLELGALGGEQACEEAALVLGFRRVGVAHEVQAFLAVAVLDGEADAVEREADAAPGAIEGLVDLQQLAAVDALADLRAVLGLAGRGEPLRLVLLRAELHHQALQELRLEAGIDLARLPDGGGDVGAAQVAVRLEHFLDAAVADVD